MAWPTEAGSIAGIVRSRRQAGTPEKPRSSVIDSSAWRIRFYLELRGRHRIFNTAEYRAYRHSTRPPLESDTPYDTNPTLPFTPTDTFANGTWWLSLTRFNGIVESGFLPLGPSGEAYKRLDITSGSEVLSPPNQPLSWRIVATAGGYVRILATYRQDDSLRATQWAIAYATGAGSPATDNPDETATMRTAGLSILDYEIGPYSHLQLVKVRLQTRRNDGTWQYSENSTVLSLNADTEGPTVPPGGAYWPGNLGELT